METCDQNICRGSNWLCTKMTKLTHKSNNLLIQKTDITNVNTMMTAHASAKTTFHSIYIYMYLCMRTVSVCIHVSTVCVCVCV